MADILELSEQEFKAINMLRDLMEKIVKYYLYSCPEGPFHRDTWQSTVSEKGCMNQSPCKLFIMVGELAADSYTIH